tara:strand:- start:253 stop:1440 length:1188 start_codon:yes stop_codon:yes gene_type:complete
MAMETKQLHALSKIYNETVAKTEVKEAIGTAIATGAALGIAAGGAALIPKVKKFGQNLKNKAQQRTQMKTEEKMAKKDYDGDGKVESSKDEYFGSKDKAIKKAMGKKVNNESYSNWRQDLKEIPDYDQIPLNDKKKNEKISEKNVKNTIKINPEMKEEYGGKKKKKKHDCASKVKHEHFGIGDCISEAHDLDENGNVAHYDVEFEEYIVRGVPVGELEILEGTMHDHVIRDYDHVIREKHSADTKGKKNCGCGQDPCVTYGKQEDVKEGVYEKEKTKEVMGALKKRDLKKDVKKKIAADIVKRKGDTSKSDDRYAYESKLWDQVAANLTELGELNDATFKVEGYQRNPEKGEEEERKAKRERKGGYDERRERRMNDPKRGINSPAFQEFMRSRGM